MLDNLNGLAEKPGFMTVALGALGLGITYCASKFGQKDMKRAIAKEFDKQKRLLTKGQ